MKFMIKYHYSSGMIKSKVFFILLFWINFNDNYGRFWDKIFAYFLQISDRLVFATVCRNTHF